MRVRARLKVIRLLREPVSRLNVSCKCENTFCHPIKAISCGVNLKYSGAIDCQCSLVQCLGRMWIFLINILLKQEIKFASCLQIPVVDTGK